MKPHYLLKGNLLIICSLLAYFITTAQVPNGNMESWDIGLPYDNPSMWESANQILSGFSGVTSFVVHQENINVHSGNYAVKLETKEISIYSFPIIVPGILTLGNLNLNMTTQEVTVSGGVPFSSRPEKLTGYYNYIPVGNDFCAVEIVLLNYDVPTNTVLDTIGSCTYTSGATLGYSYFEAIINYYSSAQPNYMNITVISSNPSNMQVGSMLYFDDISFSDGDIFFSEYIEGSSYNKALEIYNPGNTIVYLDEYFIAKATNGGGWQSYHNFPNSAVISSDDVWVIINSQTDSTLFDFAEADEVVSGIVNFNGNDARALCRVINQDTVIIDIIGDPDNNPGQGWGVAGELVATKDHTLVRKLTIESGNDDWNLSSGTNSANSEWVVKSVDEFQYLGSHPHFVPNPPTTRLAFVEYFSSYDTSCTTCCNHNQNIQSMLAGYQGNFAMITYPQDWPSPGDPYYTIESGNRFDFYGLSDIPRIRFNGDVDLSPNDFDSTYIIDAMSDTSSLVIDASYSVIGQNIFVDVDISALNNMNIPGMTAHIAIVENETFNNVTCTNPASAHYIMKKMLPGINGTSVAELIMGASFSFSESYFFGPANTVEEFSDLSVIVFVQDSASKYVHQSVWASEIIINCTSLPYAQNFENGNFPSDWTQQSNAADGGWLYGDSASLGSGAWNVPAHSNFLATNDDTCNCDKFSDRIISPCLDFSNSVYPNLSFDVFFNAASNGGTQETATLDVSTDNGQNWITLDVLQGSPQWESLSYNLEAYSGMSPVSFSINYSDQTAWLHGCAIDNFVITSPDTLDLKLSEITTFGLQENGLPVVIEGMVTNLGLINITSFILNWKIDNGILNTCQFTGLSLQTGNSWHFEHPDEYLPQNAGSFILNVWISEVNTFTGDNNLQNNNLSKIIEVVSVQNNRLPLVEYFSSGNINCNECCTYEQSFQDVISLVGSQCAVIRYPGAIYGDGYETPESLAKYNFYNISAIPYTYINGTTGLYPSSMTDTAIIDSYFFDTTSLGISASSVVSGQIVDVEVQLVSSSTFINPDMRLNIAIVENETFGNVSCSQVSSNIFMMKKLLPNENGTAITLLNSGIVYTYNFSYTFASPNTVEEFSDLSVVVFVQDSLTKYVYQSAWADMTILPIAPDWTYTNTGNSHTILIQDTVQITIDGVQISSGDYIGVFYDSLGTPACGGYIEWTGQTIALAAWGDDSQSPLIDGFAIGEEFNWKIWRLSDGASFDATATYIQAPVMPNTEDFAVNGISGLNFLFAQSTDYQYINLPQSWSIFSTYILPFEPDIDSLCAPILTEVIIAKDGDGNIYWPQYGINTIGGILIGDAYQIKLASPQILTITGIAIVPENTPVTIDQGWSLLGYLRQGPVDIEILLYPVISEVIIVKNGTGQIFWPQYSVNSIGNMISGEGYQIKMNSQQVLTYPAN